MNQDKPFTDKSSLALLLPTWLANLRVRIILCISFSYV